MTIEDMIEKYESLAEDEHINPKNRKEYRQIAEWLRELQKLRNIVSWEQNPDTNGY